MSGLPVTMRQQQGPLQLSAFCGDPSCLGTQPEACSHLARSSWSCSLLQSLLLGTVPLGMLQLSAPPSVLAARQMHQQS